MSALPHSPAIRLGLIPKRLIPWVLLVLTACSASPSDQTRMLEDPDPVLVNLAERGDLPAIDSLLDAGATPNVVDGCQWTPLMKTALYGHFATARRLLDAGADPNAEDQGGYTALMLAASRGHGDLVRLLIDRGATLDRQELSGGCTALIWAAKEGREASVEILLSQGANRTLKGLDGRDAADWAREKDHDAILLLLTSPRTDQP